jgi:hypothetical protein
MSVPMLVYDVTSDCIRVYLAPATRKVIIFANLSGQLDLGPLSPLSDFPPEEHHSISRRGEGEIVLMFFFSILDLFRRAAGYVDK